MGENNWRDLYKAAVLEVDPSKLEDRVKATERAIRVRIASLNGQISQDERSAMQDALSALNVLRHEWERPKVRELDHRKSI
jgi:hypothetical protein